MTRLVVPSVPCASCPYRLDHPSGVWAREEYEKLRGYDDEVTFGTFLCHQSNVAGRETVCRGWLTVHRESVAARLATLNGEVTDEERYAAGMVPLHASGGEAADAGLRDIDAPGSAARSMMGRLVRRGAAR